MTGAVPCWHISKALSPSWYQRARPGVRVFLTKGTWMWMVLGLADAVEAADALLEQLGVAREVEEDEVVGELEVAALAADLGADEEAGAVGFGEPGGVAVALEEGEAFVEEGGVELGSRERRRSIDSARSRSVADEEDFLGPRVRPEELGEPGRCGDASASPSSRGCEVEKWIARGEAGEVVCGCCGT